MPVFTSIGLALGASAATAFAVGAGAAAAVATAVGVGAYAAGGGFDSGGAEDRISAATGTGALTPEEAKSTAKKRAYRSGVLHTSPTGLDGKSSTSQAKLK